MKTGAAVGEHGFETVRAVADAILYEGYLLYPYRRSSGKNRVRWQFGVLTPRSWADAHGLVDTTVAGSAESWWQQTECLARATEDATVTCRLRFLQLQRRTVHRRGPDGSHRRVEALGAELPFDEAVPREFDLRVRLGDLLGCERLFSLRAPGGTECEEIAGDGVRGRVLRERWPVSATVRLSAFATCTESPAGEPVGSERAYRLRIRVENGDGTDRSEATRDDVLRWSLLASHTLLAVDRGSFLSLLDPPEWAGRAARGCANVHTFPVLAGPEDRSDLVLSSPILLYDRPRVAPESPGDLHDATEIDEILSLRTLTLTDEEKREARATDARAAAIIDRVDGMPAEVMSRLHGAVRSLAPVSGAGPDPAPAGAGEPPAPDTPWWDPGADASVSPETDRVMVAGVAVSKGSRVRLRPRRRGTDPQDVFLDGRTALVEKVLMDVDDACHLAVSIEDDPAAELNRWYGRYRYFSPDEIVPLAGGAGTG
ncbi:hypothetical protein [Actinomadura rugatobispora]|uniref:Uncharacterized protein n=1 Tax=Actinomadura rugatobispora TaxID=1994 RepID=A0ABW0ZWD1_9ACTN|nr:hypothetical protein GCM10010200_077790 [Actinomadura rugatobispora]